MYYLLANLLCTSCERTNSVRFRRICYTLYHGNTINIKTIIIIRKKKLVIQYLLYKYWNTLYYMYTDRPYSRSGGTLTIILFIRYIYLAVVITWIKSIQTAVVLTYIMWKLYKCVCLRMGPQKRSWVLNSYVGILYARYLYLPSLLGTILCTCVIIIIIIITGAHVLMYNTQVHD